MQLLIESRWLLALCGVLDAIIAVINFDHAVNGFHGGAVMRMGMLALAAGACTIAVGVWSSRNGKSWFLVLKGLAFGALGLILTGIFGSRIQFRTIALLIVLMAMSMGIYELRLQCHAAYEWILGAAGLISVAFALVFFAFVFGWIKMQPGPRQTVLWLGSYFGFSALCMLALSLRYALPLRSISR